MTTQDLINHYEKELIFLEKSFNDNIKAGMNGLAYKRDAQIELVRRFIKDLKKLLV